MCNLYTVRKSAAEVAAHFGVSDPTQSNSPEEVHPGYPGMVVREAEGARVMQSMVWGFPLRLKGMKPEAKPKPVKRSSHCYPTRPAICRRIPLRLSWRRCFNTRSNWTGIRAPAV